MFVGGTTTSFTKYTAVAPHKASTPAHAAALHLPRGHGQGRPHPSWIRLREGPWCVCVLVQRTVMFAGSRIKMAESSCSGVCIHTLIYNTYTPTRESREESRHTHTHTLTRPDRGQRNGTWRNTDMGGYLQHITECN